MPAVLWGAFSARRDFGWFTGQLLPSVLLGSPAPVGISSSASCLICQPGSRDPKEPQLRLWLYLADGPDGAGTQKAGKSRSCFLRWQGHKELGKQFSAFSVIQLHEKLGRCSATGCEIPIMGKAPNLQSFPFHSNFDNVTIFWTFCTLWIFKSFCSTSNIHSHTTCDIFWEIRYLCHFFQPFKLLMHFLLLPSHYEQPASRSQNMLRSIVTFSFFHALVLNSHVLCLLIYFFYNSEKSLGPSWALCIFHNSLLILVSMN